MDKKTSISDIQIFQKSVGKAEAGENVGINIKDVPVSALKKGMMLSKLNSFNPTNHFEGATYFLTKVLRTYYPLVWGFVAPNVCKNMITNPVKMKCLHIISSNTG